MFEVYAKENSATRCVTVDAVGGQQEGSQYGRTSNRRQYM